MSNRDRLQRELPEILTGTEQDIRAALEEIHTEDIAESMASLSLEEELRLIRVLPDEMAAQVVGRLQGDRCLELVQSVDPKDSAPLLAAMSGDDRVDLIQQLPTELGNTLISELQRQYPALAEQVRRLQVWGEQTAGGLMTPDFVSLEPGAKVWEAIERVRSIHQERAETVYTIFVVAYGAKLVGVASLRDLILADPGATLEDIMTEHVVRVAPTDDQELVADTMAKYDFSTLPVVDDNGVMLGLVTVDDVVDVVIEEATEDAQKMAAVVPLEDSYFATGFVEFLMKRSFWLLLLFVGQLITATVMERYDATMNAITSLVIFIPLIIATGGNSGAQSSTLIIRAMALGEMQPRDWLRVAGRELGIGLSLGLLLGAIGFVRALFVDGSSTGVDTQALALTVGASIVAVVTMGSLLGALLPMLIRRVGLDPAVSSTPFIASLVDVLGLVLYFVLANLIFGIAL